MRKTPLAEKHRERAPQYPSVFARRAPLELVEYARKRDPFRPCRDPPICVDRRRDPLCYAGRVIPERCFARWPLQQPLQSVSEGVGAVVRHPGSIPPRRALVPPAASRGAGPLDAVGRAGVCWRMVVLIRYCAPCNYLPRAASLAATIREQTGVDASLEKGVGGVFDVIVDGRTVFSKQAEGRFPTESEVIERLAPSP